MILVRFKGWFGFVRRFWNTQTLCSEIAGTIREKTGGSLWTLLTSAVNSKGKQWVCLKQNGGKHPLLITKTKQREWNGWMRAITQADFTSMQCMQKVNPNNLFLWLDSLVFNINSDKHIFINSY